MKHANREVGSFQNCTYPDCSGPQCGGKDCGSWSQASHCVNCPVHGASLPVDVSYIHELRVESKTQQLNPGLLTMTRERFTSGERETALQVALTLLAKAEAAIDTLVIVHRGQRSAHPRHTQETAGRILTGYRNDVRDLAFRVGNACALAEQWREEEEAAQSETFHKVEP